MYTDRYYTSLPLAHALAERSTAFTGTDVRNRQSLPDSIRKPALLADNEVKAFRSGRFLALEWRAPTMVSTQSAASMTLVHTRQNQGTKEKPVVVHEYNHSMNGLHRADQNSVYSSSGS